MKKMYIRHAKSIADFAGIVVDEATLRLYAVLRGSNDDPDGYCQMSDQRLFGEVLLMVGDLASFERMKVTYHNISFS